MTSPDQRSGFVTHAGVRLHYVVAGRGPLLFFIHGIPDFWKGWIHQLDALSVRYRVAAMDLRGVNFSDKPKDVHAYRISELLGDVLAVLRELGGERATIVGHDWGALLGWWLAVLYPDAVAGLAALAAPHPLCYLAARRAGDLNYSQAFTDQILAAAPGAPFDADRLSAWVSNPVARSELTEALLRSSPESIRNYYRANLPVKGQDLSKLPYVVKSPVLIMYGTEDHFIPHTYYELSAKHVAAPCDIVPISRVGHGLHVEAADATTGELVQWLACRCI